MKFCTLFLVIALAVWNGNEIDCIDCCCCSSYSRELWWSCQWWKECLCEVLCSCTYLFSSFIVVVWSLSTTCSWIWIICWSFCQRVFFLYFFDSRDSIIIAEVNADEDRILAERFEIAGFPTLKFFPAGAADAPEDYEGGRTAMDLVRYTNEKIGIIYYNIINK